MSAIILDRQSATDVLAIVTSRGAIIIGQLYYVKLFTGALSDYELGVYYFLTTLSYSLNAFVFVPLDAYQQSKTYSFLRKQYSILSFVLINKKIFKCIGLFTCFFAGMLYLFFNLAYMFFCWLVVILAICLYVASALRNLVNNLEHRKATCYLQIIEVVAKIIVLRTFFEFFSRNSTNLILSNILSVVLIIGITVGLLKKVGIFQTGELVPISLVEIMKFAYPISLSAMLNWVQLQSYRLIFVSIGYTEFVGIFASVTALGVAAMSAASIIYSQCFLPLVYKSSGANAKRYVWGGFGVVGLVSISCLLLSDFLVPLLTKPTYGEYSYLIVYGVFIEAGNFIIGSIGLKVAILGKTEMLIKGSIVSAGFALTGLVFFCFSYFISFHALGLSLVVSQCVMIAYMYHKVFRNEYLMEDKSGK